MTEQQTTSQQAVTARQPRRAWLSTGWLLLCLAFVFVRLPFIFTVPAWEAPDEYSHHWVIWFIHQHLRLPSAQEVVSGGIQAVYGSLPQFGYLPHLAVTFVTPSSAFSLFERFGSLLAGLTLLYAAYQLGREIFVRDKLLALCLPLLVIFHPQLAFVHAYANNDATASALSALILLLTLRAVRRGVSVLPCAASGALLGWLALSKYSGLGILPPVALAMVAACVLHKTPVARALAAAAACLGSALAVSGWWFVRNAHEYPGDPLGTKTMFVSWARAFNKDLNYHVPAWKIAGELRWWRMMYFSFWGLFGYMNKYMWRPVYIAYVGFLITAAAGWIRCAFAVTKQHWSALGEVDKQNVIVWVTLAACVTVNLGAMIWASTSNLGGPQGRYLFNSEIPVLALFVLGLNSLGGRWGKRLVLAFVAFNALVCLGVWVWMFSMYGFHCRPM